MEPAWLTRTDHSHKPGSFRRASTVTVVRSHDSITKGPPDREPRGRHPRIRGGVRGTKRSWHRDLKLIAPEISIVRQIEFGGKGQRDCRLSANLVPETGLEPALPVRATRPSTWFRATSGTLEQGRGHVGNSRLSMRCGHSASLSHSSHVAAARPILPPNCPPAWFTSLDNHEKQHIRSDIPICRADFPSICLAYSGAWDLLSWNCVLAC